MPKVKNATKQIEKCQLKNISIVGYSAIDITVFVAIAMHKLGYNVLISDLSPESDIVEGILQGAGASVVERYGFFASPDEKEYSDEKYNFHITYYGRNIDGAKLINRGQIRIMTTDMYAEHARILSSLSSFVEAGEKKEQKNKRDKDKAENVAKEEPEVIAEEKEQDIPVTNMEQSICDGAQVIILNELAKIKYGEKYLLSLISHKEIKKVYRLFYNTKDLEAKLSIGHEKVYLRNLTENYKSALNEIVSLASGQNLTKKQLRRIYSK